MRAAALLSLIIAVTVAGCSATRYIPDRLIPDRFQSNERNAEPEISGSLPNQAAAISERFTGRLQPLLRTALASGGPVTAISVCAVEAPKIAEELSEETGWQVRRVSLRPRNAINALPDEWERAQLLEFDARQQAGEPGAGITAAEEVDGQFRYMQAQPALPMCLTCHGNAIALDIRSALQEHYPGDMATGYAPGQIRGAISLSKAIP